MKSNQVVQIKKASSETIIVENLSLTMFFEDGEFSSIKIKNTGEFSFSEFSLNANDAISLKEMLNEYL